MRAFHAGVRPWPSRMLRRRVHPRRAQREATGAPNAFRLRRQHGEGGATRSHVVPGACRGGQRRPLRPRERPGWARAGPRLPQGARSASASPPPAGCKSGNPATRMRSDNAPDLEDVHESVHLNLLGRLRAGR